MVLYFMSIAIHDKLMKFEFRVNAWYLYIYTYIIVCVCVCVCV